MRIGIVAPPWAPVPPTLYGGIELVVDRLARGFAAEGHEVVLFTTGDSTCPVDRRWVLAEAEGVRIGDSTVEIHHVAHAYDALASCDIVHDHTVVGPIYAARAPDVRVVTTIHGVLDDALRTVYREASVRAQIIAISYAQRRVAPDIPIARVIHHGIDAGEFPLGAGDGGYALFLGRLDPYKGAHHAIEAARKAGLPLLMAGKMRAPWERDYYDQVVAPLMGDDVRYLGEVSHEEKVNLLARARATLFPIRWNEPFGLVMLESLACGTPVLAFPDGAAPEVIKDGVTGFLCADEIEMAEALGRVSTIDRATCRASVEGQFSTKRMVREHLELFSELVA